MTENYRIDQQLEQELEPRDTPDPAPDIKYSVERQEEIERRLRETFSPFGNDLFGDPIIPQGLGVVSTRFTFPPFTALDAKQGAWLERKRAWLALGIQSECGRDIRPTSVSAGWMQRGNSEGGSIFDPVLVELIYRWFCPAGGQVVDPFAGGSVRGIVASQLGRQYWGCDLRPEQIEANREQGARICAGHQPVWVCGDSTETLADAPLADFIISCPPYGDLEVYSTDPADLSNMEWHTFLAAYRRIVLRTVARLKEDRFACFVVGDFRDEKGFYRNFVSETIGAFEACGARLYNEAILLTPVGSACLKVTKQFDTSRKMAKIHQNVLVFCKGNPRTAATACNGG